MTIDRRRALGLIAATGLASSLDEPVQAARETVEIPLPNMTCFIRYQIDPHQREAFLAYAQAWGRIIPRCGGHLIGYFAPWEGTNDVAWGLISFDSLAAYEAYRERLKTDPEARANFAMAQTKRLILREERSFLENVDGTLNCPAAMRP